MTEAQIYFVQLERKYAEYKDYHKQLDDALRAVHQESPFCSFQDDEGIVYQIVVPTGTFVYYKPLGYERTKRKDEKKGSLSVTKAQELGFKV